MRKVSKQRRKCHRRHSWRFYVMAICLVMFVVSGIMVLRDMSRSYLERQANESLAEQVSEIKKAVQEQQKQGTQRLPRAPVATIAPYDENGILIQYSALYQQNADLFGWLSIDGTAINYPVMYTPDRKEYYLRRGFDKKYALSGCLFIDEDCNSDSNHLLIYGHHMKDGTMFGTLPSYAEESYAIQHPLISFDTLRAEGTYQVIGAFYCRAYKQNEEGGFRYYQYTDLSEPERFEEYVAQVKAASLYDTGVEASYGDSLLTLSTCSYHTDDGRFVVVAKKAGFIE